VVNIFRYKGFSYNKKYGHITIRQENIKCKDEYEFPIIIEKWLKDHDMNKQERTKYTSSTEWKELRNQVLKRQGNICYMCKQKKNKGLHIHHGKGHQSYGKENLIDMFAICSSCHKHVEYILSRSRNKIDLPKYWAGLKEIVIKGRQG
jgi:hypothetical protein